MKRPGHLKGNGERGVITEALKDWGNPHAKGRGMGFDLQGERLKVPLRSGHNSDFRSWELLSGESGS